MREKLIEDWMDNAGERDYQPVFCQALAAAGYIVLHSTRHGPMELGKDVIAKAPNGEIHAFQLKGNPGSRLTLNQWNALIPQINSLIHHPVEKPLVKQAILPKPFLVTNGYVEEEAQHAISAFNDGLGPNAPHKLEVISRGELLDRFIRPALQNLWPDDFKLDVEIFTLLSSDGSDTLPISTFNSVINRLFTKIENPPSIKAFRRIVHGVAIIAVIAIEPWSQKRNYVALIFAYTIFLINVLHVSLRFRLSDNTASAATELIRDEIFSNVRALMNDIKEAAHHGFYHSSPLFEFAYQPHRLLLLKAIIASAYLSIESDKSVKVSDRTFFREAGEFAREFLSKVPSAWLVGEAQIPQLLAFYWYLSRHRGDLGPDSLIASTLMSILKMNLSENRQMYIAGPYYDVEDILKHLVRKKFGLESDFASNDSFYGESWFAMPLFGILVRRNLKQTAKRIFEDFSRLIHKKTKVGKLGFCSLRDDSAQEMSESVETPGNWAMYLRRSTAKKTVVNRFFERHLIVLMIFLILCPHRATEDVVYWLDQKFLGSWHT